MALENRYKVEMHVHSIIFQSQVIAKKIRSVTFIVWVLGRVEKKAKKSSKKCKKYIFLNISKCDTCFYIYFSKNFQHTFGFFFKPTYFEAFD